MKGVVSGKFWTGDGRKIIIIPRKILKSQLLTNPLISNLYIANLGYYPKASRHYTLRKNGLPLNLLIYCVAGSGWVRIGSKKYSTTANNFFILPCNVEHEYAATEDDPWTIYWIEFGGNGLAELNQSSNTKKCFKPTLFTHKTEANELFNKIFNILTQGYSKQYLIQVNMLFGSFLALFLYEKSTRINVAGKSANQHDMILEKAIAYMQSNLQAVSIAGLANEVGCSQSQLFSVFKKHTGYSPINYFNHLKIQKACQYLYATDTLVKEVAAEVGFDDPFYFSRLFTKLIGISPLHYRMKMDKVSK